MSDLIATHGNNNYSDDGIQLKGEPGIKGKRRERRMMQLANSVFMRRERGMTVEQIADELHTSHNTVQRILHDTKLVKRRLDSYDERIRAATPIATDIVYRVLHSTDPKMLSEQAAMAKWVIDRNLGKDPSVNIFVKGGDTVVNVSNDTLEAAKAVSQAMMAASQSRLLSATTPAARPPEQGGTADSIDAEAVDIPTPTEENSKDEHTRIDVGQHAEAGPATSEHVDAPRHDQDDAEPGR